MARKPTPDEAMSFMYDALVLCRVDLAGEWSGWKIRGRVLVSPDGDRIPVERLRGLLFTESLKRQKRNKPGRPPKLELDARPRAQVVPIPPPPAQEERPHRLAVVALRAGRRPGGAA